jgi:hypothetical protein
MIGRYWDIYYTNDEELHVMTQLTDVPEEAARRVAASWTKSTGVFGRRYLYRPTPPPPEN